MRAMLVTTSFKMKFVAVVLLAVCVVLAQGYNGSDRQTNRGLKDEIEKLIKGFKYGLEVAHEQTVAGIQKGIDAVDGAFDVAVEEVDKALNKVLEEIRKLEEDAAEQGVETVECTQAQRDQAEKLREDTLVRLRTVGDETVKVLEDAQTSVGDFLNDAVVIADNLMVEFNACSSLLCGGKVLTKAGLQLGKLTLEIPGIVGEAVEAALVTSANGIKSVEQLVVEYVKTTAEILAEVRQCIEDKINAPKVH